MRVANWREKTERSRIGTLRKRSKTFSSFIASFFSETSSTMRPRSRSCSVTCPLVSASTSPREGTPATSTARNAYVLISSSAGHGGRNGAVAAGRPEQPLELLGHRGTLLGELPRDAPHADQRSQVGIHGLHSEGAGSLDRGVDLVRLALADQVAHRRRRDQHLGGNHAPGTIHGRQKLLGDDPLEA